MEGYQPLARLRDLLHRHVHPVWRLYAMLDDIVATHRAVTALQCRAVEGKDPGKLPVRREDRADRVSPRSPGRVRRQLVVWRAAEVVHDGIGAPISPRAHHAHSVRWEREAGGIQRRGTLEPRHLCARRVRPRRLRRRENRRRTVIEIALGNRPVSGPEGRQEEWLSDYPT